MSFGYTNVFVPFGAFIFLFGQYDSNRAIERGFRPLRGFHILIPFRTNKIGFDDIEFSSPSGLSYSYSAYSSVISLSFQFSSPSGLSYSYSGKLQLEEKELNGFRPLRGFHILIRCSIITN